MDTGDEAMRTSFCSASDLDTIEELVGGLSSTSEETWRMEQEGVQDEEGIR